MDGFRDAAVSDASARAAQLARTLAVARALVLGGRAVDLRGIEDGVGALCARTLDLGPADAKALVPALHALRARLDELAAAVHQAAEAGAGDRPD